MADFLVCTLDCFGLPEFAIYRGEEPAWWPKRDKIQGSDQAFMRELSAEEAEMSLDELRALWAAEKRPLPNFQELSLVPPPRGELIPMATLAEMLVWPLVARKMIFPGDTFRLEVGEGGVRFEVIPQQPMAGDGFGRSAK